MSAGPGPLRVETLDGAVWVRAAVTRAGLGLYCPEGVTACPRFVMATLVELAEHGVKAAPSVTSLPDAVALMGALPMPVGTAAEANPVIVSRFDVAIEPAPEEDPVLIVGAVADNGRPVALLLDEEARAKVGGWLVPELEELRARVAELEAQSGKVETFCAQRAEYVTNLRQFAEGGEADYFRWQGHAAARRQLSQSLGLPVGWPAEDKQSAPPAPVEDPHDSPLHRTYVLGRDLPEVTPDPSQDESVAKLRALLSRQTGGAQ
ncbi:hypothetical protein ABZ488_04780 [Streptomyces griseus]|uniref:hypothetical protein n=1 Tax=Streptomyces griseus TaxID=1911 RepID=UPI0033F79EBB